MSEKDIKTYTSEELDAMRKRGESQTDWERLAALKDEDIDYSDIPELDDDFWANAKVVMPKKKEQISLKVDREVLKYFRKDGPGYQTRMNAVLKSFVAAHRDKSSPKP